jgi:FG-GAP repeat
MPTIIDLATLTPEQGFSVLGAGSPGSAPQPTTIDRLGRSVSSAGDVNGDGIDDFILGAPFFDVAVPNPLPGPVPGEDTGAAYIIYGRTGPLRSDIDLANLSVADGFRIEGEAKNHYAGSSVSAAGDVNGDGIDDFIVGARYGSTAGDAESFEGKAYVVYGKTGLRTTLTLSTLTATEGFSILGRNALDNFGTAVSAAGDINGDGFDDIILGAPSDEGSGNAFLGGAVYVVFGRGSATRGNIDVSSLSTSDGFQISGSVMGRFVGVSVSDAGDFNGDGIDDIVFGSLLRGIGGTGSYSSKASSFMAKQEQQGQTLTYDF